MRQDSLPGELRFEVSCEAVQADTVELEGYHCDRCDAARDELLVASIADLCQEQAVSCVLPSIHWCPQLEAADVQ